MSCETCTPARKLPTCTGTLTIGTIAEVSASLYLYIRKVSNGAFKRVEAASDAAGLVTADLSDIQGFLHPGSQYELWISTQDAVSMYDREEVTIGEESAACLVTGFERIAGASGNYTLQLVG